MAISTLAGSNKWIEIATASPTSGSTLSFTSIPEYKELLLQAFNATTGAGLVTRLNNDTGSNYSSLRDDGTYSGAATSISTARGTQYVTFQLQILDANSGPKSIAITTGSRQSGTYYADFYKAIWNDSAIVNRIDVIVDGAGDITAGTFKLYGRG